MNLSEIDPRGVEPPPNVPKIGYIDDSLVVDCVVPETDITPAVRFKYHPLSAGEFSEYLGKLDANRNKSLADRERVVMQHLISKNLREWDLTKPNGEPVDFRRVEELQRVPLAIIDFIGRAITRTSDDIDKLLGK